MGCNKTIETLQITVYETSESGNKLTKITDFSSVDNPIIVTVLPEEKFQTITGFGGSFTESSAYLLNQISKKNRDTIIEAYFGESGAKYSLTRTHMNSCDFSLSQYSYAPVVGDMELKHFSIQEDKDDIIPMIKDAMAVSKDGFKILSSPWTAAPWMKDNNAWVGGKLLPKYYETWALFFSKYINAYKAEGIDIWGFTVENEPLGNGEQGSRTALPIWIELMRATLENAPESSMNMPKDMVTIRISKITGCPANSNETDDVMFEVFHKDNLPSCEENNQSQDIFN